MCQEEGSVHARTLLAPATMLRVDSSVETAGERRGNTGDTGRPDTLRQPWIRSRAGSSSQAQSRRDVVDREGGGRGAFLMQ